MNDRILKEQLIDFLTKAQAHMTFVDAIEHFPEKEINTKPLNVEYSFWDLLEHIRITQKDILEYMNSYNGKYDYKELEWPKEYWPKKSKTATKKEWDNTVENYKKDIAVIKTIIEKIPLTTEIRDTKHTMFREILMIIDHTSYHIGEFAILRKVVDNWKQQ